MTIKLYGKPSIAGTIKFDDSISSEKLIALIHDLVETFDQERLIDLHVRGSGDDCGHFIMFHYEMKRGSRREQKKIGDKVVRFFGHHLGYRKEDSGVPNGCQWWSMSTVLAAA